jgi:hypothetical protein
MKNDVSLQILPVLLGSFGTCRAFALLGVGAVFDDKGTVFALPDMSAKFLSLNEGQEIGRSVAKTSKKEDVDSVIRIASGKVARETYFGKVRGFLRDNSLLKLGDDTVSNFCIDVVFHNVSCVVVCVWRKLWAFKKR